MININVISYFYNLLNTFFFAFIDHTAIWLANFFLLKLAMFIFHKSRNMYTKNIQFRIPPEKFTKVLLLILLLLCFIMIYYSSRLK